MAGVAGGVLCAARAGAAGTRPRRWLREHRLVMERASAALTIAALGVTAYAAVAADHPRAPLAATCAATAVLLAIATWLILVERDEGGETDVWGDPKWWPQFERDLAEWTRHSRVPAGRRN
jgi:hypothetical protein